MSGQFQLDPGRLGGRSIKTTETRYNSGLAEFKVDFFPPNP